MSKRITVQDGNLIVDTAFQIAEQAAAADDVAGYGQLWVRNDSPNVLVFTDDTGLEAVLGEPNTNIGTTDGDMLYWDQTGTQKYLASSILSWNESTELLTIGTNGWGIGQAASGFSIYNNVGGELMNFHATDVILVESGEFRLSAGNVFDIHSTGGSRFRMYNHADDYIYFTGDGAGVTHAQFDYPVFIEASTPTGTNPGLGIWCEASTFSHSGFVQNSDGLSVPLGSYESVDYEFNNPTAAADPGGAFFRCNTADFSTVTEIYFNDEDNSLQDQGDFFNKLAIGDLLMLQHNYDTTRWLHATIDAITDNTGWWTIDVTPVSHNGTVFINGTGCRISYERHSISATGNVGGSITDNQIAVGAATADDIEGDANFTWDGTGLAITNLLDTGDAIRFDYASTSEAWISGAVNAATSLYYNGDEIFRTTATGIEVAGSLNNSPTTNPGGAQDAVITLTNNSFVAAADIGFTTGATRFDVISRNHGANVLFAGEDTTGTLRTVLNADPDSATELRGDTDVNITANAGAVAMTFNSGGHLVLPQVNDAATPTLSFGDGDSGFYEESDDVMAVSVAGTRTYLYNSTAYASVTTSGFYLDATASSSTNPAFTFQGDTDTGIGRAAADQVAIIAGAVEANRITAATVQTTDATVTEIIGIAVASGEGFGFRINLIGTEDATGDTVFENIFGAIRNQAGTTALVGSSITDRTDDAGASTWAITVAADDTTDELTVDVTGEAAHTIDWKVSVELLNV